MTPPPQEAMFPTLLEMPRPIVRVYSQETVIAEKTEALVKLGMVNTRLKDYFDLYFLATKYRFDGWTLSQAMRATFTRRGTDAPNEAPIGLTAQFGQDADKLTQWNAFCRKSRVPAVEPAFPEIVAFLATFLLPPLLQSEDSGEFRRQWVGDGRWS